MSLQDELDAFKADFKAGKAPYFAPPEIHPVMERATAELIASGPAERALKAGVKAPGFNGDPSWTLPMPARYVVGQDGTILYSEVNPDYTRRPEPSDMLPALRRTGAQTSRGGRPHVADRASTINVRN